jgi:tetratricopeptide (TPR) repeat protein/adenylate kinase family enzyme
MAELIAASTTLGVVSSLITIADVAWRVLKRLDEYSDRTKDVPGVIKHIRPQLLVLAEKMEELRRAEKDTSLSTNSETALSKTVEAFEEQIKLLDELTVKMLPVKGDSKRSRARKAILSIYYEKELSRIWTQLETYKTTFLFHFTNVKSDRTLEVEVLPVKTHYHYPTLTASRFVVRERPLQEIEAAMGEHKDGPNPRVVVLLGMGGSGKTQLALQYCQQAEARRQFMSIFWVDASTPAATAQSFVTIAGFITNNQEDLKDNEVVLEIVKESLSTWTDSWLIVFDNFDDPNAFKDKNIKDYFPQGTNGAILFTTRHGDVKRLGNAVAVGEMSEDEGLELLFGQTHCDRSERSTQTGKEIITRLGNLALAIDQAGAYISVRNLPLNLFLDHYNNRRQKVLQETPSSLWEYRRRLSPSEAETSLSVFTTWEMSFEQINDKTEEHLLILSAFFDNADIFEDIFKSHFETEKPEWMNRFDKEGDWDSYEFLDVLAKLAKISLIRGFEITTSGARFSFHPLVQEWIKLRSSTEDRQIKTREAIEILAGFINNQDFGILPLRFKQTILSHLNATLENETMFLGQENGSENEMSWYAAGVFGEFYSRQGQYEKAEALYARAQAIADKILGSDSINRLSILNNLAILYENMGRLPEAEAMYKQSLAGKEKILGQNDLSTLQTLNNLAILYETQGRMADAEAMYDRALRGMEETLGKDHKSTLVTVHNIAVLYEKQGCMADAEAMYGRALRGSEKTLGKDHESTLETVNNIAVLYEKQGRMADAEAMFDRALRGKEETLGRDHKSTLVTVNTLRYSIRNKAAWPTPRPCTAER